MNMGVATRSPSVDPCPTCETAEAVTAFHGIWRHSVRCKCPREFQGPWFLSRDSAIASWNAHVAQEAPPCP